MMLSCDAYRSDDDEVGVMINRCFLRADVDYGGYDVLAADIGDANADDDADDECD